MPGQFRKFFEIPLWNRGFRPLFLLGAAYAVLMIFSWVLFLQGAAGIPEIWDNPALWHAHEMIYGFTVAIIAGFLLTAVANWTGGAPVRQAYLALLCALWLAGRLAFWLDAAPALLAVLDLSFLPLLAVSLSIPLLKAGNKRNFIFLGLLGMLFLGNLYMHLTASGIFEGDPRIAAYVIVLVVMLIISLVGSRIIPSFTVAGLRMRGQLVYQEDQRKTDTIALLMLLGVVISVAMGGLESRSVGYWASAAGLLHLWRMRHWHSLKAMCDPMLWVLHAGHLWLIAGLLVLGLHGFGVLEEASLALHLMTVGSIGSMTIGMMARVALGHTGRQIAASKAVTAFFWMMQGAALVRSFAIIVQGNYIMWITGSGLLWSAAFAAYLVIYAPILLGPRPDGLDS